MPDNRVDELLQRAKSGALADLPALASEYDKPLLREACRSLDGEIQRLARLTAYLDQRGGCGYDQGHATAVKRQHSLATKIRRALGFSYPRQDITFPEER